MDMVLVHGMGRMPLSMLRLHRRLRRSGHHPVLFGYSPTFGKPAGRNRTPGEIDRAAGGHPALRSQEIISWTIMGALAGCDARRRARRMAIPCKRPATPQRARRHSQNVQVIVSRLLSAGGAFARHTSARRSASWKTGCRAPAFSWRRRWSPARPPGGFHDFGYTDY